MFISIKCTVTYCQHRCFYTTICHCEANVTWSDSPYVCMHLRSVNSSRANNHFCNRPTFQSNNQLTQISFSTLLCTFKGHKTKQMKRYWGRLTFIRRYFLRHQIRAETRRNNRRWHSLALSLVLTLVMSIRYCSSSSWLSWQPASSCQTSALSGSGMPLRTSEGKPLGLVDRFPCLKQTQKRTFHYFIISLHPVCPLQI